MEGGREERERDDRSREELCRANVAQLLTVRSASAMWHTR
jgi:hypothetical protein